MTSTPRTADARAITASSIDETPADAPLTENDAALPRHIGIIVDGNRRWAREMGVSTADGHRAGAQRILDVLGWCEELGIPLVTIWMLSTDNLSRTPAELDALCEIIGDAVDGCAGTGYRVRIVGDHDVLPTGLGERLTAAVRAAEARHCDRHSGPQLEVNLAIGYGGREEIVGAVRSLLRDAIAHGTGAGDLAEQVTIEAIGQRLHTAGQPDPDLIIRTSGEQRMSGFLLWQSVHTEYWFTDANWPGFQRSDLLDALADYARRERRFGA